MKYRVAILGVTGAVGQEFLRVLERDLIPISEIVPLASSRSAGTKVRFRGENLTVIEASPNAFHGVDIAFFSAGAHHSREYAEAALEAGCLVIDNSSAYRMVDDVPLIVPEVNGDLLQPHHRLVANPNCTAAILLMAISPLRKLGNLDRLIISTYQSASGAGASAMEELRAQTLASLKGEPVVPQVLPHPYAFNLFSHNTAINDKGLNDEEAKVIEESRKMLGDPGLRINVTCVRVPVMRAHSLSVTVEFGVLAPSVEQVREVLLDAEGITVVDDRAGNHFPMPLEASGRDEVLVGRLRPDPSNPNAFCMFICGDQLLKGAALNAVQIAQLAHTKGFVQPVPTP